MSQAQPEKPNSQGLYEFLHGIEKRFIKANISGWIRCEIVRLNRYGGSGHYYPELVETDKAGKVIAKVKGTAWAGRARDMFARFKKITGRDLSDNTKVLLHVTANFKPEWGFSLDIDDIDPSYTLGDLEARKQALREQMQREGIWNQNKGLPSPQDYLQVAVVASSSSAGIGDFRVISDVLHKSGLCSFQYFDAVMQGEKAPQSICNALDEIAISLDFGTEIDAVVILRGGGATTDLLAFNDERLVRAVAKYPIPVISAIGHQRDSNLIDEVAWKTCANPKEASVHIKDTIILRTYKAKALMNGLLRSIQQVVRNYKSELQQHLGPLRESPLLLREAERLVNGQSRKVRVLVEDTLSKVQTSMQKAFAFISHQPGFCVNLALNALLIQQRAVIARSMASISRASELADTEARNVSMPATGAVIGRKEALRECALLLKDRSTSNVRSAKSEMGGSIQSIDYGARHKVERFKTSMQTSFEQIQLVHPDNVLRRGYSLIQDPISKRVISRSIDATLHDVMMIRFMDGNVAVRKQGE